MNIEYLLEYTDVAEPRVRFTESHASGLSEPVFRKSSQWFRYGT